MQRNSAQIYAECRECPTCSMQNLRNSYVSPSGTSGFESKCVRNLTGRPLQPQHSRQRKSSLPLLFFSFHLYHPLSPHSIILPPPNLYPPSLFFFLSPSINPYPSSICPSIFLHPLVRVRVLPTPIKDAHARALLLLLLFRGYRGMQGGIRGKLGKEAYRQALPRRCVHDLPTIA